MRWKKKGAKTPEPVASSQHLCVVHKLGSDSLVLGLPWRALRHTDPGMRRAEAKESASVAGSTFGAVIESSGGRAMIGLLPSGTKAKPGAALSGAGWLACSVDHRVFVVMQLASDRWWLAMVRPSEVESNGDFVGTSEDVGSVLDSALNDAQRDASDVMPEVIVIGDGIPKSYLLEKSTVKHRDGTLKNLLSKTASRQARFVRLRGIAESTIYGAAAAVLLVVLVGAGWWWNERRLEREALEEARQSALLRDQQAREIQSLREARMLEAIAKALAADTATAVPGAVVKTGLEGVLAINPYAAGWRLTNVTVSASGGVATKWELPTSPHGGDNVTFAAYAESLHTVAVIDGNNNRASFSFIAGSNPVRAPLALPDLPDHAEVLLTLGTWLQRYQMAYPNTKVTLAPPKPKSISYMDPTKKGGSAEAMTQVPASDAYQVGTINISGSGLASFESLHPDYPYVTFSTATLTMQGATHGLDWNIGGTYVTAP